MVEYILIISTAAIDITQLTWIECNPISHWWSSGWSCDGETFWTGSRVNKGYEVVESSSVNWYSPDLKQCSLFHHGKTEWHNGRWNHPQSIIIISKVSVYVILLLLTLPHAWRTNCNTSPTHTYHNIENTESLGGGSQTSPNYIFQQHKSLVLYTHCKNIRKHCMVILVASITWYLDMLTFRLMVAMVAEFCSLHGYPHSYSSTKTTKVNKY